MRIHNSAFVAVAALGLILFSQSQAEAFGKGRKGGAVQPVAYYTPVYTSGCTYAYSGWATPTYGGNYTTGWAGYPATYSSGYSAGYAGGYPGGYYGGYRNVGAGYYPGWTSGYSGGYNPGFNPGYNPGWGGNYGNGFYR